MYRLYFLIFCLAMLAACGDDSSNSGSGPSDGSEDVQGSQDSQGGNSNGNANGNSNNSNGQPSNGVLPLDSVMVNEPVIEDSTVVTDVSKMPDCNADNEGEAMMVISEDAIYFCSNGEWVSGIVETLGVSCDNGTLVAGASDPVILDSIFGLDSTGTMVYRREGLTVAGLAEKGPFRYGTSVTLTELDSMQRMADSPRIHKACITSSNGSYAMENVNLVSPYVRVEASGYYRNEMTGGLSSELVTLKNITDLTERDSVNVNILTHIDAIVAFRLVEQGGFNTPIRMVKEQSLKKVLYAFGIKIEGFNDDMFAQGQGGFGGFGKPATTTVSKISDEINLYDGDEFAAALLAVSVMLQRHGSGQEMLLFADSIGQKIAGSGNWDDWNSRAHLADWLMALDLGGGFEKIRKNVAGWGLGEVPDFEKYLRKFWTSEYQFPACTEANDGMVTHIGYSQSDYFGCNYQDTTKTRVRFTCDAQLGRWRAATDIEKDTVGLGADTSKYDGAIRPGVVNMDKSYIYEKSTGKWREATSDDIMDFTDVADVYSSLAADESVVFVLRHAERTNETGSKGHLTDNGKAQAKSVGTKFKSAGPMYFAYSGYTRTLETCEGIASGAGLIASPEVLDGLDGNWYAKSGDPTIENLSSWAYRGYPADNFYDLEERSMEFVKKYVLGNALLQRVNFYISHDKMVLPFAVFASKGKVDLRFFDVQGTRNWINYLAGVAVIFNRSGQVRYVPVRGLESGTMKL